MFPIITWGKNNCLWLDTSKEVQHLKAANYHRHDLFKVFWRQGLMLLTVVGFLLDMNQNFFKKTLENFKVAVQILRM
jgi:hypothetical protein